MDREIHVCLIDLALFPNDLVDRSRRLLAPEETERANRIVHLETQRSFVIVRASLRALLGRIMGVAPNTIRFELGEKGKPRLAGFKPDEGLVFNVSHSGGRGLIALAYDTTLGVDVEKWRVMKDYAGIAERCFSAGELACWRASPPECQQSVFFALWSLKEAFVKATGEGISLGLASCVVDLARRPRLVSIPPRWGEADAWRLNVIDAGEGFSAGICHFGVERPLKPIVSTELVNTLLNIPI